MQKFTSKNIGQWVTILEEKFSLVEILRGGHMSERRQVRLYVDANGDEWLIAETDDVDDKITVYLFPSEEEARGFGVQEFHEMCDRCGDRHPDHEIYLLRGCTYCEDCYCEAKEEAYDDYCYDEWDNDK